MKVNKQSVTIFILVLLLLLAVGYMGTTRYQSAKQSEQLNILQQGVQLGYEQAITQLMQQASTCQPVPIWVGNQTVNKTLNLIAVECLQAQQQTPSE